MRKEEIRLGNVIQYARGVANISGIDREGNVQVGGGDDYIPFEELRGVQLTTERIYALGFELTGKHGSLNTYKNGDFMIEFLEPREKEPAKWPTGWYCAESEDCKNYMVITSVNSVHELQNLYSIITGEELKC